MLILNHFCVRNATSWHFNLAPHQAPSLVVVAGTPPAAAAAAAAAAAVDATAAAWRRLFRRSEWIVPGDDVSDGGAGGSDGGVGDSGGCDTRSNPRNSPVETPATAQPTALVSVVLVTYNRPRLLRQALDSLARQDHPREQLEVVVVDDGSEEIEAVSFLDELELLGGWFKRAVGLA